MLDNGAQGTTPFYESVCFQVLLASNDFHCSLISDFQGQLVHFLPMNFFWILPHSASLRASDLFYIYCLKIRSRKTKLAQIKQTKGPKKDEFSRKKLSSLISYLAETFAKKGDDENDENSKKLSARYTMKPLPMIYSRFNITIYLCKRFDNPHWTLT